MRLDDHFCLGGRRGKKVNVLVCSHLAFLLKIKAEKEGFEPSDRVKRSTVFETAPFDHSGISPWIKIMKFKWILQPEKINNIRKIHRRLQPHAYHDPKIILRQIYGAMSRGIIII